MIAELTEQTFTARKELPQAHAKSQVQSKTNFLIENKAV